jgi:hypothetical protein
MMSEIPKTPHVVDEVVSEEQTTIDIEGQIVARVVELTPEIDPARLGKWLVTKNWNNILGKAWAHHVSVEEKAQALVLQAKCDLRPPIARAKVK